jgi:hypothetical protein
MKPIFHLSIYVLLLLTCSIAKARDSFANWTKNQLILSNGIVHRLITLPDSSASFGTTLYLCRYCNAYFARRLKLRYRL